MRAMNACVPLAALCLLTCPLSAETADPHLGTWKLNQEKSRPADRRAKAQRVPAVLKIRPLENGHSFVSVHVTAEGHGVRVEYVAHYDAREYPRTVTIDGKSISGTVSTRRIDAYTHEQTFRSANGSTVVQLSVVSRDGKTRTHTISSTNADGQETTSIAVYDRM